MSAFRQIVPLLQHLPRDVAGMTASPRRPLTAEESPLSKKKPMSNKVFGAIWIPILSLLLIAGIVANVLVNTVLAGAADSQFGAGTTSIINNDATEAWNKQYYQADVTNSAEAEARALETIVNIQAEGITLLKNEGNTLPLVATSSSPAQVTLLGRGAADPVFGGSGSGSFDMSKAVNLRGALESNGFEINSTVFDALAAFAKSTPRANIVMDKPAESNYYIGEMPVAQYTDEQRATFSTYDDAAIVVIARGGGEGGDLATDMSKWDQNYTEGQHQLELNQDERDLIDLATQNFDKVVVLINASMAMELSDLQANAGVDAIAMIGSTGQVGMTAVAQVLNGEVNPSGHLVDIYPADFTADPTFNNFGSFEYANQTGSFFANYAEGIYYGYRYYETAAVEGFINYDEAVVYPFGYGLSYTDFTWTVRNQQLGAVDGEIVIDVEVTNTGEVAGKDVVQLYYTAPYTPGGIEKAHVVLGDFAKTGLLEPGQSETVQVTLAVEDMASYDYEGAGAYVLEAGTYELKLQTDSHRLGAGMSPITYEVANTVTYGADNPRATDDVAATNQFDDVSEAFADEASSGKILNFSRADFAGTFPQAPAEELYQLAAQYQANFTGWNSEAAQSEGEYTLPTQGANGDLGLIDMRGLTYDDPQWEELLNQISVQDMTSMLTSGAYNTAGISSIAKPRTNDPDGPAGFSSFVNNTFNLTGYPSAVVIASTWSKEVAREMGQAIGNEALNNNISGWYAPAMNIHRSPFAGRNFEYYSEDPVLAGIIGGQVMDSAADYGVYSYVKHFAMNDQEGHRVDNGLATWATEQTIREVYLKPFEIALDSVSSTVKYISDDQGTISESELGATAVMSSFNRIGSVWAGGSRALMHDVLRAEWGFAGIAITDFNLYPYMIPDQAIWAGTDLMLTFEGMKSFNDTTSAFAVTNLRTATHNVLYAVANSNAMNGIATGATAKYIPPAWRYWQIGISVALGVALLGGTFLVWRRMKRHSAAPAEAATA